MFVIGYGLIILTLSPTSTTINLTTKLITIGESWIEAGFSEGDKLRISSNDGNDDKFVIIIY